MSSYRATPKDRAMLLGQEPWPYGHLLPVKRYLPDAEDIDFGCVIAGQGWKVYRESFTELAEILSDDYDGIACDEYPTLDAMLEAGWIVD